MKPINLTQNFSAMKKMKNLLVAVTLATSVITLFSCSADDTSPVSTDKSAIASALIDSANELDLKSMATIPFVATDSLTPAQIEGILFMREEEKLAHDVYTAFYTAWNLSIFNKIAQSELRHTEKMLELITFYGLTDPAIATAGVFSNQDLQSLYDTLIAQGSVSAEAALQIGALIEEVDILDLKELLLDTTNANLSLVYSRLMIASGHHLKGFVKVLSNSYNITYTPQLMDIAAFELILATPGPGHHGGNGGNGGNGSGSCGNTGTNQGNGHGHHHGHGQNSN
jgi:hypothetical protein